MNTTLLNELRHYLLVNLQSREALLLPMRFFIGLGWLRASVEKLVEPGWHDGSALTAFLNEQLATGTVHFPFYQTLITDLFQPNAQGLAWVIMIGQLLAGIAIVSGFFTNLALLGGLFMNLNFILIGQVNPSAFYVVMQGVLFVGNVGAIIGADAFLSQNVRTMFVTAQPPPYQMHSAERRVFLIAAIAATVLAVVMIPFIRDFGPHSVDDPAMLLFILSLLSAMTCMILVLQQSVSVPQRQSIPAAD